MSAKKKPKASGEDAERSGSTKGKSAPISVAQLAALIDSAIKDHVPTSLKVIGEIGRFTPRTHWYFDLKDAESAISCVMWQSAAKKAGFEPRSGQQVVLTGRVEFYPPQGRTQFIADKIESVGAGSLDLAFRQLCEDLRGLGWFDEKRKRALPLMPRKLAIVTSRTGAALQDVLDTVRRRCPSLELALVDVRVQGDGAAEQVARAVRGLSRHGAAMGVDVILVTRGGGSLEDLWAFNERIVAEAIVSSTIPVVAAIGHEIDTTIAELVADVRGATPTQAAMRIAPDAGALREQLRSTGLRLSSLLARQIRLDSERLRSASRHSIFADPMRNVDEKSEDVESARADLAHAIEARLQHAGTRLEALALRLERHRPESVYARRESRLRSAEAALRSAMLARIESQDPTALAKQLSRSMHTRNLQHIAALDSAARALELVGPRSVLSRGYSMTLDEQGKPIRSTSEAIPGRVVRTRVLDGSFTSTVTGDAPSAMPLPQQTASSKPRRRLVLGDGGPGLFEKT